MPSRLSARGFICDGLFAQGFSRFYELTNYSIDAFCLTNFLRRQSYEEKSLGTRRWRFHCFDYGYNYYESVLIRLRMTCDSLLLYIWYSCLHENILEQWVQTFCYRRCIYRKLSTIFNYTPEGYDSEAFSKNSCKFTSILNICIFGYAQCSAYSMLTAWIIYTRVITIFFI